MLMQNGRYVTVKFIADILESNSLLFENTGAYPAGHTSSLIPELCHSQFLFSIFLVQVFCYHPFDTVEAFPDIGKGKVERRETQTEVIGRTEVRDDVQVFDEGAVDAIAVWVADGDVGAANGRVGWGAEGKAQRGEPSFGQV